MKKVALELGGKNPNIVFADADLDDRRSTIALTAVFLHSGQVCSAGARLVVEESHRTTSSSTSSSSAPEQIRLGGPFDDKAETGAADLAPRHRDKVEAYVAAGVAEGAVLRCGGARPDDPALADGFYYLPTILDGCTSDMSRRPGRVVRPGADRRDLHRRGRRRAHRQRQRSTAWPARSGPRTPARASGSRRRLRMGTVWINDYHPYVAAGRVGRLQAVRHRPRARPGRARGVPRDQARLAQHRARPPQRWFGGDAG